MPKKTAATPEYDVTFVGHMCYDEIIPFRGKPVVAPGSAVLCGAMAAARIGKRVAAVVKMSPQDKRILKPLKDAGVDTYLIPAAVTTYSRVTHESENVDERRMTIVRTAGRIAIGEVPELRSQCVHLAGISDSEFDLDLLRGLKARGGHLSVDWQSFVRQITPGTNEIKFADVAGKAAIARMMDKVKLDVIEAKLLTGSEDLEQAARIIESWGCPEVVITQAGGVLARAAGKSYFEKFTNLSIVGRTGRGDTVFAAYLCRRLDHSPEDSLKFAAALVSIKMESPGPFHGTLEDVFRRMREDRP
jgi:sugar/nucleoside kinase (ribokinase family)